MHGNNVTAKIFYTKIAQSLGPTEEKREDRFQLSTALSLSLSLSLSLWRERERVMCEEYNTMFIHCLCLYIHLC